MRGLRASERRGSERGRFVRRVGPWGTARLTPAGCAAVARKRSSAVSDVGDQKRPEQDASHLQPIFPRSQRRFTVAVVGRGLITPEAGQLPGMNLWTIFVILGIIAFAVIIFGRGRR